MRKPQTITETEMLCFDYTTNYRAAFILSTMSMATYMLLPPVSHVASRPARSKVPIYPSFREYVYIHAVATIKRKPVEKFDKST